MGVVSYAVSTIYKHRFHVLAEMFPSSLLFPVLTSLLLRSSPVFGTMLGEIGVEGKGVRGEHGVEVYIPFAGWRRCLHWSGS